MMKGAIPNLTGASLLLMSRLCFADTNVGFDDSIFNKIPAAGVQTGEEHGSIQEWSGQIVAQAGFATREHSDSEFNRQSSGLADELLEVKVSHPWQLSPTVKAVTGLSLDARFYSHQERSSIVSSQQYEKSETELTPGESYIEWDINKNLWFRHGYYVVSYGMSDAFAVIDKLSPRDNSRWGQEPTSKTRKPLWLSQLTWQSDGLEIGATVTHGFKGDHIGLPSGDYDAFLQYRESGRVNDPQEPEHFKPEWIINARKNFRSGDWEILAGDIYDKSAVIKFDRFDQMEGLIFSPVYTRTKIAGLGVDYVTGDFVWKGEAVWLKNYWLPRADFFPQFNPFNPPPSVAHSSFYQTLIGVDYTAPWSVIASLEIRQSTVADFNATMIGKEVQNEYSIQLMKKWLNDRLYSQLRLLSLPDDAGRFYQIAIDYDLNDDWKLSVKYTDYVGTESNNYFERFRKSDRFLVGCTFQF